MAEFYSDVDEEGEGIASPDDCWELVGSISPLPEAKLDVSALEEAMAVAGESGSLLQDDYFGHGDNASEEEVLPVSSAVAEKQSEGEGHTESVNEVVSLEPDKDASLGGEKSKSDTEPSNFLSETDAHNVRHPDGTMYHDDQKYHDGKMHSDAYREGYKMHNEYMMHLNVLLHQDDRMHHDDKMLHDDIIHSGEVKMQNEDEIHSSLKTGMPKMAPLPYHDIGSTLSSPSSSLSPSPIKMLDLPYKSHTSSHDMEESFMSIQQSFLQSGHPASIPNEGRSQVVTPHDVHGGNSLDSADLDHHGTVGIHNSRRGKGFPCASWIWTQLGRWQTQLGCANTIWSVALAAAVMGIFVLGRGWQRLQAQNRRLRTQLCAKDKKITQLMFQLIQAKDSLSKTRRIPVIWAKPSLQIPQDN